MTAPILDEATAQRRRTLLIASVLSAVVLLVAIGVTLAILANRPRPAKPALTPAEQTTATPSGASTPSPSAASSASATGTATTGTVPSTPATSSAATSTISGLIVRSGSIAYRSGGRIWVAGQDGSGAKVVLISASGAYALSPDGRTLVAQSGAAYVLVDVESGTRRPLSGPIELPVWAPDSSWLAYTTGSPTAGYSVYRVNRDGGGATLLFKNGAEPQIAPDGTRVAFTEDPDPGATDPLRVYDTSTKTSRMVPNGTGAIHWAWTSGGALYFVKPTTDSAVGWLGKVDKTLAKSSVVASLPVTADIVFPGPLLPSPDGSDVLFAMTGDDGYSRMMVGSSSTSAILTISTVYDAYPMAWLLDGSAVLYIEGNAIQHETTALYRIRIDGSHRALVVKGAGT